MKLRDKYQLTKINCPICNFEEKEVISPTKISCLGATYEDPEINIVMCKNCGMIFEDGIFDLQYYRDYYNTVYYQVPVQQIGSIDKEMDYKLTLRMLFLKPYLKKGMKVLEIGSWTGKFLNKLKKEFQAEVYGIEACSDMYNYSKNKYPDVEVQNRMLEDFETRDKFDLIVMGNVIDHLTNPIKQFSKLKSMLKSSGVIYLDYGLDMFDMHNENGGSYWSLFSFSKRTFWTDRSINNLLNLTGLKIVSKGRYNSGKKASSPWLICNMGPYLDIVVEEDIKIKTLKYFDQIITKPSSLEIFIHNIRNKFRVLYHFFDK